jgi:hypothetical protein
MERGREEHGVRGTVSVEAERVESVLVHLRDEAGRPLPDLAEEIREGPRQTLVDSAGFDFS